MSEKAVTIMSSVTGREQRAVVSPRNTITLVGCDGELTPAQGAVARTILDEALALIATREGPQSERSA